MLASVAATDPAPTEEIFGPCGGVMPFDDEADAIRPYGLSNSTSSSDPLTLCADASVQAALRQSGS